MTELQEGHGCGQNGGQYPHDYPLTLFRFPAAQSARPTTPREPAVRPESTTLMSSSTPAPDTGSHSLFRLVGPAGGQRSDRQSQAKPGCAYGGPGPALGTSTVALGVFHRAALPCLSALQISPSVCVYKDVFWQIAMRELCPSAGRS